MEPGVKALGKLSQQIKDIQATKMEYSEEQKERKKYKKTCTYCQQHLLGRKNMKVGDTTIDLEKNGEGYCKLCESKFCSKYPTEEICNQISGLKTEKISKAFSKISLRKTARDNEECQKCVSKGNKLKNEGKLSMDDDETMRQSCVKCKKTSCSKDVVLDEEDEKFCQLVNDLIEYYIIYKKSSK